MSSIVIGLIITVICSCALYTEYQVQTAQQDIRNVLSELEILTAKYNDVLVNCNELRNILVEQNDVTINLLNESSVIKTHIVELIDISNAHEFKLNRLSNGTSNADVLDEMGKVKIEVHESMQSTYKSLNSELSYVKHNVSSQLKKAQTAMDITATRVDYVVANASTNLRNIQAAVMNQLSNISAALNHTLVTVNEVVSSAAVQIHHQVSDVQDSINEYVAFSNKQFAAENDFVKYQLAGELLRLCCCNLM